jgi:4-amino-4-deoxy-L-arabinose transferase-like glycosyltransferase
MSATSEVAPSRGGPACWWPEAVVAGLAAIVFLASLGSVEMWGKREQRAALEAADTVDNHHWLVAEILGHPRLEKPPLSRWAIGSLMALTGRRDEWIVRLPAALSGIAMVGLVYTMGRRLRDRAVGLASAAILCSTPFFIAEMRQAGNDALLALLTTLAIDAAWRRLDSDSCLWARLFGVSLGLGILAKGPIILMLVGVALIPYLLIVRNVRGGLAKLLDGWGLLIFAALALSWPVLVILNDPNALGVWGLEMGQKTGISRLTEHRWHFPLIKDWPGMMLPWAVVSLLAVALPFLRINHDNDRGTGIENRRSSTLWLPWCWAVGNLLVFCLWRVAKPSYYLPCMPGMALLLGAAWVRVARAARLSDETGTPFRFALQLQWVMLFVGAILTPLIARHFLKPQALPWMILLAGAIAAAVIVSATLWRKGADNLSLLPFPAACALVVAVTYGVIAPTENPDRGLRGLAHLLDQSVPPTDSRVLFLQDIDEGLPFYSRDHRLEPVPGTERRYNAAYDYVDDLLNQRRERLSRRDVEAQVPERLKQALIDWLDRADSRSDYILLPTRFYDRYAAEIAPRTVAVLREEGKKRDDLTLLRIRDNPTAPIASTPFPGETIRK